ncbi:MAG: thiol peroxidase [Acidobacteria bacterium]|nr:thiol peroxidase [Acidobacteriota bacterium]
MAQISLGGNPVNTNGDLPAVGDRAPHFELTAVDLSPLNSSDLAGQRVVLSIFPSLDTATCQAGVRAFNERVSSLENTVVVCASADLPFAAKRFCGAENIENVLTGSTFKSPDFARDYGVALVDGKLEGLCARSVVVFDEQGIVTHSQLVPEIGSEPDYDAAIAALS